MPSRSRTNHNALKVDKDTTYVKCSVVSEETWIGTFATDTGSAVWTERMLYLFWTEGVPCHAILSRVPRYLRLQWVDHELAVDMADGTVASSDRHFGKWWGELDCEGDFATMATTLVILGFGEAFPSDWRDGWFRHDELRKVVGLWVSVVVFVCVERESFAQLYNDSENVNGQVHLPSDFVYDRLRRGFGELFHLIFLNTKWCSTTQLLVSHLSSTVSKFVQQSGRITGTYADDCS